jgi:hypothetical protein
MNKYITRVVTIALTAFILLGGAYLIATTHRTNAELKVKTIQLKTTDDKLKDLQGSLKTLELDRQGNAQKIQDLLNTQIQLENEKAKLEQQLQAKLLRIQQARAYAASLNIPQSHADLMTAAGIAQSDWGYVNYIVTNESGWNPDATNASSGAHGLPQALPYSKTGCGWSDAVCQLKWANMYATQRYGSWYNAYIYWQNNHNW